jgi:hypothetical protein
MPVEREVELSLWWGFPPAGTRPVVEMVAELANALLFDVMVGSRPVEQHELPSAVAPGMHVTGVPAALAHEVAASSPQGYVVRSQGVIAPRTL